MSERASVEVALPLVHADWGAPAHVVAFCTTRAGGVSDPPWDALNLGLHVGDDPARVRENRRRLVASLALPSAPAWLRQVHGTRVVRVGGSRGEDELRAGGESGPKGESGSRDESGPEGEERAGTAVMVGRGGAAIEADGAWTDESACVVGVLTADCLPVVVTDAAGARVAVVHAGWRGLAGGVLREALAPFDPDAELHVWLGPAIGPAAFEVGAEVREAFVRRDAAHETSFVPTGAPGKYLGDLYALARRELGRGRHVAATHVTGGDRCTVTETSHFHSHRRDGARSGRMATLAWRRPDG